MGRGSRTASLLFRSEEALDLPLIGKATMLAEPLSGIVSLGVGRSRATARRVFRPRFTVRRASIVDPGITPSRSGVFGLKTSLTKSAQDIADKVLKTSLTMWSNSGPWIGRVLRDIWCGGR